MEWSIWIPSAKEKLEILNMGWLALYRERDGKNMGKSTDRRQVMPAICSSRIQTQGPEFSGVVPARTLRERQHGQESAGKRDESTAHCQFRGSLQVT